MAALLTALVVAPGVSRAEESAPAAMEEALPSGGWYRLTNLFLGEGRSLDTYAGDSNQPFMGTTGDYSGQYWKLTRIQ